MNRLFATLFAFVLLTAIPALAVDVRSGVIVVHNQSGAPIRIGLAHQWASRPMEETVISPGGTYYSHVCCYAAGSPYAIFVYLKLDGTGGLGIDKFWPRLCNRSGAPYGYMAINVYAVHRVDMLDDGCPLDKSP